MYYCVKCDKKYKTSRSLDTHNSRYHPYSKKVKYSDNVSLESEFDEDRSTDVKQYSQIIRNKSDLTLLKNDIDKLSKQVWDLDMKMLFPKQMGSGSKSLDDNKIHKEELESLKDQERTNKVKLSTIEDKLESLIESVEAKNRVVAEDLIDDLNDVKELFMKLQYEKIISDIPRLRLVAKFVISLIDNCDIGFVTDRNIELLEQIGDSSKTKVKILLKEHFNTLVGIFTKLKIDELYESKVNSECEDSDSVSDDESGSERSDKYPANKEHSNEDKSDSDSSNGEDSETGISDDKNSDNIASSSGEEANLVGGSDSENSNNVDDY